MAARAQEATLKPRHRVLIVDDDESTRMLLARLLSKALNVEAQLVGGLGVLAAIRAASPNAATPVIIVCVVADDDTVARCMMAGATAYHVKPIRRAELVSTVRAQLAARNKPKPPREDHG